MGGGCILEEKKRRRESEDEICWRRKRTIDFLCIHVLWTERNRLCCLYRTRFMRLDWMGWDGMGWEESVAFFLIACFVICLLTCDLAVLTDDTLPYKAHT